MLTTRILISNNAITENITQSVKERFRSIVDGFMFWAWLFCCIVSVFGLGVEVGVMLGFGVGVAVVDGLGVGLAVGVVVGVGVGVGVGETEPSG